MDLLNTGHASLKLQKVDAAKGDYYYLSVFPGEKGSDGQRQGHVMPMRLGQNSINAVKAAAMRDRVPPKYFSTSTLLLADRDGGLEGRKPDMTFRFNGPDRDNMQNWCMLQTNSATTRNLKRNNCATLVAECLKFGGAPDLDIFDKYKMAWTPVRLAEWCTRLVIHYPDSDFKTTA